MIGCLFIDDLLILIVFFIFFLVIIVCYKQSKDYLNSEVLLKEENI